MKTSFFSLLAGLAAFAGLTLMMTSCKYEQSGATGWNYNDERNGGFEKAPFLEQETGPGLVLIEGGSFTMGRAEQDVMYDWDHMPRRVTVSSFYMDETEVTNEFEEDTTMLQTPMMPDTAVFDTTMSDTLFGDTTGMGM